MAPAAGSCDGSFAFFFYDPSTDDCHPFTYTGCDGNKNRFRKRAMCLRKCQGFGKCPV